MKSCGMSIVKYTLFVFNLIFTISGIGIIVAGGVVLVNVGEFSHFVEGRILAPPIVLIVAGVIVFVIAFLGCFGAIKESSSMLIAFAVALLLIFVIELAVGIAAAVFKNDFSMILKGSMKDSLNNYTETDQIAWETLQKKLQCCGVESAADWNQVTASNWTRSGYLPPSCCKDLQPNSKCGFFDAPNVYEMGCYEALERRIQKGANVLIVVGIGIAFVEIGGIILALCLAVTIKREAAEK